jgi:hypothetical protein
MRCPNCGASVSPDERVCDVCGATLSMRAAAPQVARAPGTTGRRLEPVPPTPVRRVQAGPPTPGRRVQAAPPTPPRRPNRAPPPPPNRRERRPGTLGDLFSRAISYGPALLGGRNGAPGSKRQGRAFPRFGPQRGPQMPSAGPELEWDGPPQPEWPPAEEPRSKGPYRRNTAGVVGDLRSALEQMPFVPGKRGIRDRILHPRPSEGPAAVPGARGPRVPGWLVGRRQEQQPPSFAPDASPDESWGMPPDSFGRPGPVAAPPAYRGDWDAPAAPQGGGWGFAPSAAPPPAAAARDPWRDPAIYNAPPSFNNHGGDGLDSRYDTGHGWSIVTSSVQDDPSRSYLRLNAVQPAVGNLIGGMVVRILGDLTRFTFNLVLLGIILTILAIPTAIGLSRLSGITLPIPWIVVSPTPRPIPTPSSGYHTYKGSTYNIAYPAAWKAATATDPLHLGGSVEQEGFSGPGNVSFNVGVYNIFPKDQLTSVLETGPKTTYSQGKAANFQVVVTPRPGPTLDGQRWMWEQFTYDWTDGQRTTTMEAVVLIANQGLYTYIMMYQAPAAQFANTKANTFDPMVGSFRFGY